MPMKKIVHDLMLFYGAVGDMDDVRRLLWIVLEEEEEEKEETLFAINSSRLPVEAINARRSWLVTF